MAVQILRCGLLPARPRCGVCQRVRQRSAALVPVRRQVRLQHGPAGPGLQTPCAACCESPFLTKTTSLCPPVQIQNAMRESIWRAPMCT